MPKPSRGGRRTAPPPPPPPTQAPTPPPKPQPAPQTSNSNGIDIDDPNNGVHNPAFKQFQKLPSDQQAVMLAAALKQKPPAFLPDNSLQRLTYYLGGDDKPTVMTDQQLDTVQGQNLFRQVAGVHLQQFKADFTSADIVSEIVYGEHTMFSNQGGSAHGRSIYWGKSYTEIRDWYGNKTTSKRRGGADDRTMIRIKINPKSKGISESALTSACSREISSGSKLGKLLATCDRASQTSIYALCKGYDYSYDGARDYHMVYNRGCMLVSSRTKHNVKDSRW